MKRRAARAAAPAEPFPLDGKPAYVVERVRELVRGRRVRDLDELEREEIRQRCQLTRADMTRLEAADELRRAGLAHLVKLVWYLERGTR